ncbi:B-cell antigen receptor complex-associated protein alpha chain [Labrus mixtus]|uniref:B-cell antigen receptor complex-associated protein alpha chain n=1 Tax=Labrus mixtus TaxID=508554 RepID=UPI0029C054EB|nr:B-cell antigen receptor complex-associated protein alpha chain [Labrus mixtus]
MGTVTNVLLCSFVVVIAQAEVTLKADRPFLWVQHEQTAVLECCYTNKGKSESFKWVRRFHEGNKTKGPFNVTLTDLVTRDVDPKTSCGVLNFLTVQLNDSGMYQCWLEDSRRLTHGTYLHVYKPLEKTIDLNESTKNKILMAEGVLLLFCVLLPAATLIFQSKRHNKLEMKKVKTEEDNIYEGLNLDDCCAAYDQIERSQTQGQYQDVCNVVEEEEEIQLEKP